MHIQEPLDNEVQDLFHLQLTSIDIFHVQLFDFALWERKQNFSLMDELLGSCHPLYCLSF